MIKKWKRKKYNYNNELIIEEYKNGGKWNSKAKKYIKNLINVGKYLNFEKNGKIKLNYDNGNLMFEGELLKGKINGKGKIVN